MRSPARRRGNEQEMMSVFKHTKEEDAGGGRTKLVVKHFSKRRSTMHIFYDEASLKERRDLARGVATVHQMELAHIVTAEGLQAAPCTNAWPTLGPPLAHPPPRTNRHAARRPTGQRFPHDLPRCRTAPG